MGIESGSERKEQNVARLMSELEAYFGRCVEAGMDNSQESFILWNSVQAEVSGNDEYPTDVFYDLYQADPDNFMAYTDTILHKIKAGPGLRQTLEDWATTKTALNKSRPKHPENN